LHTDFTAGRGASYEGHRESWRGAHCPLISELYSPHSGDALRRILWPPRVHNVLVSGYTQLQPLRCRKPDAAD